MATPPLACPVCAALLLPGAASTHIGWHAATQTLDRWTAADAQRFAAQNAAAVSALAEDDYPTAKLPPIRETVLRRPPAPEVRELRGAELLRALADELARDEDQGGDPDPVLWPPCEAGVIGGRECRWPTTGHPCLGYGSVGCGMKAQES